MNQSTSSRVKSDSLDMLVYFDQFCKKHNIEYCLSFGTELGAVRHGGFIPWDDDIDVDMMWEEYVKFEEAWEKDGDKEQYFLQTKETDLYISSPFPRIRKNGTTSILNDCEHIPIHWGLPLDIFPVFNSPKFFLGRALQVFLYKAASISCLFNWNHVGAPKFLLHLTRFATLLFYKGTCAISSASKHSGLIFYPGGYPNKKKGEKAILFPAKPTVFENHSFLGPADPDKYLTWQYDDYMTPPPEDKRGGHAVGIIDLDNDYSKYTGHKIQ